MRTSRIAVEISRPIYHAEYMYGKVSIRHEVDLAPGENDAKATRAIVEKVNRELDDAELKQRVARDSQEADGWSYDRPNNDCGPDGDYDGWGF